MYVQSRISRTPYPPIGGPTLSQEPKIQSRHHLVPQRKLRLPKFKYEALEISEVREAFERKCLYIAVTLGPFERKVAYLCITVAVGPL